jgi:membrane dipeptidase
MKKILPLLGYLLGAAHLGLAQIDQNSKLYKKADKLAHQYIIADGHVDLPYRLVTRNFRLEKQFLGIPVSTPDGDFDYERAKKGGLSAPFMSIYIPSSYQKTGGAKEFADSLINMVQGIARAHPDKFAAAYSPADIQQNFKRGLISLPMGMENGAPLGNDLRNVAYFHQRGIRYITLTHATDNLICDSSYDTTRTWKGLSPFGLEVVKEMNRVGIMVDISHVSDSTFYQVMRATQVPCIASHSSCRTFTPGFERNMSDDMIRLLAKNGGVIQINFATNFIDGQAQAHNNQLKDKLEALLASKGIKSPRSPEARPYVAEFAKANPTLFADVERVADHIDHVVKLAGIDHVGLGSDFDGVGDTLPTGLKDVSQYPNLLYILLKRGYSSRDIEKICYKNLFRVWEKVQQARQP